MMKYIYAKLLIVGLIITGLLSCNKFLDIKPKGFTIPEFFDDYSKLMNNQALIRVSSAYPNYITDDVRAGEVNDVAKGANFTRLPESKKNLYLFNDGQIFLPGETDPLWEPAYNHIFTYNTIINNVLSVPDATESERKRLRAEALMSRAFEYLVLVNAYSVHYNSETAKTDLGVPIILSEDINEPYIRNTVEEVYNRVKSDLEEAIPDLPDNVSSPFRPTKSVAYSFLSRMYLYMGNYEQALTNANTALGLNSTLLDYKLYTTKNGVTFGRICLEADTDERFPEAFLSPESIWVRYGSASSSSVNAEVYASQDLLDVFNADLPAGATDQRMALFFCKDQAQFGPRAILFPGRYLYAPYTDFNLGLSTSELFLIAAECEARVGSKDVAVQHLNTLRNMRIKGNLPLSAANSEEALRLVLNERRREMCYLGCTRIIDLKRLNRDTRFAKSITHEHEGETYTLPPNDARYILPLPPKVLEYNESLPEYDR